MLQKTFLFFLFFLSLISPRLLASGRGFAQGKKMFLYASSLQYGSSGGRLGADKACLEARPKRTKQSVAILSVTEKDSMRNLVEKDFIPQKTPIYDLSGKIKIAKNLKQLVVGPGTLEVDLSQVLSYPSIGLWSGSTPTGELHKGVECCNCWGWKKSNGVSGTLFDVNLETKTNPKWRGSSKEFVYTSPCMETRSFLCLAW